MTYTELVADTCERLNLTSADAFARVGRNINLRYKRLTSSIGLETSRFAQVHSTASIGNQTMTFTGVEKLINVIDKSDGSGLEVILAQVTPDELHITPLKTEPPRHYAVTNLHSNSVDIRVDCIPKTNFILYADAQINVAILSGNMSPDFPESFHEILIFGAKADELKKMEKPALAQEAELEYEKRLSDLRMWIAKNAYLDIYQGRYAGKTFRWTRNAQINWDA